MFPPKLWSLGLFTVLGLQDALVQVYAFADAQSIFANTPRYKSNLNNGRQNSFDHLNVNTNWGASYDDGLFTPLEDFSLLSESQFTTLFHPAFPKYGVRVKKAPRAFCDETVGFVLYPRVFLVVRS